jgi:Mn-dependent DtxR family transcriptional regulator
MKNTLSNLTTGALLPAIYRLQQNNEKTEIKATKIAEAVGILPEKTNKECSKLKKPLSDYVTFNILLKDGQVAGT